MFPKLFVTYAYFAVDFSIGAWYHLYRKLKPLIPGVYYGIKTVGRDVPRNNLCAQHEAPPSAFN